jgi:transcriptional regulator with XRE-family HTH domain
VKKRNIRFYGSLGRLPAALRCQRQKLRLSQSEVAVRLGVSEVAVGFWESGKRAVELDRVPHLAEVLALDPTALSLLALSEAHPRLYRQLFPAGSPANAFTAAEGATTP